MRTIWNLAVAAVILASGAGILLTGAGALASAKLPPAATDAKFAHRLPQAEAPAMRVVGPAEAPAILARMALGAAPRR